MGANDDGYFAGAKLLATDARVATLLLREGRNRVCERLFGVSGKDSGIVALVAVGTLAYAVHDKVRDMITAPGGPTASDALIGAGILNETVRVIAGEWSREEAPIIPALIVAAVVVHHVRPWARGSLHDIRAVSDRIRTDFDRRYGHLIRPDRESAPAATRAEETPDRFFGDQPQVELEPPRRKHPEVPGATRTPLAGEI